MTLIKKKVGSHFAAHTLGAMKSIIKKVKKKQNHLFVYVQFVYVNMTLGVRY